jgi:hypothetical protein
MHLTPDIRICSVGSWPHTHVGSLSVESRFHDLSVLPEYFSDLCKRGKKKVSDREEMRVACPLVVGPTIRLALGLKNQSGTSQG